MKRSVFSKLTLATLLLLMAQLAFAQVREKRDVSNFNELSVSDAFVVELSVGSTESLEIEVDERYINDVVTQVRGGKLIIEIKENRNTRRMKESPRAYLTVKSLDKISLSGAVNLTTFDPLEGDRLDVDISGASVLKMEVEVEDFRLEASGACVVKMEGTTSKQLVKTSGATSYSAYDLESEYADIRVSGAGSARVSVSEELDVRASGASDIKYRGRPSVNSNTSGASSVRRGK